MADLTLREAALELGLQPDSLRVQIRNGRLRGRKVGRDWLVTRAAVARYDRDVLGRRGPRPRKAE